MMNKIIIDKDHSNMRLDKFIRKYCKEESLQNIFKSIRTGLVKVNGKKKKQDYRLNENDELILPFNHKYTSIDNDIEVDKENKYYEYIIYEDDDMFIVNKPKNIAMHKGSKHHEGLVENYRKIFNNKNINFANRLDYDTSGLVIGTKNLQYLRYMSEEIRENRVTKEYIAEVEGNIEKDEFIIENYLLITENNVRAYDKYVEGSKKSISKYTVLNRGNNKTILKVKLITGRKHQIRVQLSSIGHPVIGDKKYGKKSKELELHCYKLIIDGKEFTELEKKIKK